MADIVHGNCQKCGIAGPVMNVTLMRNIGVLVMRFYASRAGFMCRRCIDSTFWEFTLITFFLGWWGMISFFFTPIILITNFVAFVGSRKLPFADAPIDPLTRQYAPPPPSKWPFVLGGVAALLVLPCVGLMIAGAVAGPSTGSGSGSSGIASKARLNALEEHLADGQSWGNNEDARALSATLLKELGPLEDEPDGPGVRAVATEIAPGHVVTLVKFKNMTDDPKEQEQLVPIFKALYQPQMRAGDQAYVAFTEYGGTDAIYDVVLSGGVSGAWKAHTSLDKYAAIDDMAAALNAKPKETMGVPEEVVKTAPTPATPTDLGGTVQPASGRQDKSGVVPAVARPPKKKKSTK